MTSVGMPKKASVDGSVRPRARRTPTGRVAVAPIEHIVVDARVMAAARNAIRHGQRLVIVSATEVRLVNDTRGRRDRMA